MSVPPPRAENPAYLLFMLLLSLLALIALGVEVMVPLQPGTRAILSHSDTVVCGLFFIDFLISLYRAPDRRKYMFTWGWLDLLSSIPMVDSLRWGRAGRILRLLRLLRGVRTGRVLFQFVIEHRKQSAFMAALLLTLTLIAGASIAILHFELDEPAGNIHSPEDALWWAVVTITTVGYGDKFPVSEGGRVVAGILMISGVGLFGMFSGFLASWFVTPAQDARDQDLKDLRREVGELKQLLNERLPSAAPPALGAPPTPAPSPAPPVPRP